MDPRLARQQLQQQQSSAARSQQGFAQNKQSVETKSVANSEMPLRHQQRNMSPKQEVPQQPSAKPKLPEGPLKRNKNLQENEPDLFQPRFQLSHGLPEIPVRPKLFKYRLDTQQRTSKYEFTTVELNQDHLILVDYNMGARVDLVDRGVYAISTEQQQKMGQDTTAGLSERDKFLLSDRDTIPVMKPKNTQQSVKLEPKHDNPALIQMQQQEEPQIHEDLIISGAQGRQQSEKAIEQINRTFNSAQLMKVGATKPSDPLVTAVSVTQIVPSQLAGLISAYATVVNDDEIGEIAREAHSRPNGIMLRQYTDIEGENRQAYYHNTESKQMPETTREQILGKRTRDFDILKQSHIKDYTFSEVRGGIKGEKQDYMLVKVGDTFEYVPLALRMKLNKKRMAVVEAYDSDGCAVNQTDKQISEIFVAPRGLTNEDRARMLTQVADYGLKACKVPDSVVIFEDKAKLDQAEDAMSKVVETMFKGTNDEKDQENVQMSAEEEDLFAESGNDEQEEFVDQLPSGRKSHSQVPEDDIF